MGKFWAVFKREYLERVRTKSFLIFTVLGPMLISALMIVPNVIAAKAVKDSRLDHVQIIDASNSGLGQDVRAALIAPRGDSVPALADSATLSVKVIAPSELAQAESLATAAVIKKELTGYVVLDSASVAGVSSRYAGREASSLGQMEVLQTAIQRSVLRRRLLKEGLDPARITALTQSRLQMARERISDKGRGGSGIGSVVLGGAVAVLLYFSLILYGQNILRSVLEEKTTRVAEVIVASVKTDILLAGKVFGVTAVSLTQTTIWVLSTLLFYFSRGAIFAKFGITGNAMQFTLPHVGPGMAIAFVLLFVFGLVLYSSLFAAAGATVSSDQEAQQAAQPIMMLIIASVIFVNPVIVAPMSGLAKFMSWLPFSAPIVMPLRMSMVALDPMEIALVLLGIAVSCAVSIWVSARIYRVGLLMYGKKPSFKELGRWIAQS